MLRNKANIIFALISILFPTILISSEGFEKWKSSYIRRASKRGLPKSFLKKELMNVEFDKEVIKKDRNQITSNKNIDYHKWMKGWMGPSDKTRTQMAKEMLKKHGDILNKIEKKYNVDKEIIISLWGVETFFGRINGDYDLVSALSSLAYKSRRKKFFEVQLSAALRLIYRGHVKRENLKGSWAGATGQLQFMPSNFNAYARDYDGDKKIDIWQNHGDIFASIANFLKKAGWKRNAKIGYFVKKRKSNFDGRKVVGKRRKRLEIIPFQNSPLILRGQNYKAIMRWNKSSLFAAFNMIMMESMGK